jgi:hypothetical protein
MAEAHARFLLSYRKSFSDFNIGILSKCPYKHGLRPR